MKKLRFTTLTLLGFTYLSCSSKPVEFYSTRKQGPQATQRPQGSSASRPAAKEAPPTFTTEAVTEAPTTPIKVSTENLVSTPGLTLPSTSIASAIAAIPDSLDGLALLRH